MAANDLKILAIDDNRDNLTTLQAVVADRLPGVRVLTALDGRQGLAAAQAEDPDVILLDIVMPGMDGYEVCRKLKADKRLQAIPVLFLTALRTDLASRITAMDVGAEGFLSKPFDEIELVAQIRAMAKIKALNRHRRLEQEELAALVTQRTRQLVQELTERRRVESDYAVLFREMFNGFALHEIITDEQNRPVDYRFLAVNPAFELLTGLRAQDIVGKTALEVIPGLEPAWIETYGRVALSGEPATFENYAQALGKHFEVRAFRPAPGRFACIFSDITERKRAEDELRESEARYRALFENSMDAVMLTAPESGRILSANPAACRIFGRTEAELRTLGREAVVDPGDRRLPELLAERTRTGMATGELTFLRKDGSSFPGDISSHLFTDESGDLRSSMIIRDITERNRLAEEKVLLEDQLRQVQKVEAIGRLAGGVAHDFNNLTAIVLGYGEMLLGRLEPEDPARKWAEQIVEAGRRSAALTRQLLAFSRKQTLQPEVLDLNALLRNLEKMLGRLISEDIRLELRLAADLGRVTADPGQLEQVITNLVLNARDAMPLGGRLVVETANVELDEAYALSHRGAIPGSYVLIALADTGCGMDKATMGRLFEPFFTTKPKGKGTGLGLATAFGVVKQSGGHIWADSEPGAGTTFKIFLPRTDREPIAKLLAAGGALPRGAGELVLLVEDQAALRGLCETILSRLGYRVVAAGNGLEALNLVREAGLEPDLVLTDVIMPDMSGAEMAERLRGHRPGLRVLYMSGYPDAAIARHGVLEPGTLLLQKPFSEPALAAKVREALGEKSPAAPPGRRVLMIDDDEQYRELVRLFCAKRGHVFAGAASAAAALAALAGQSFDVLLIDLNIPGTSGERVLQAIRAAGHIAPAIVLTGDVAAADMDVLRPLGALRVLEKSSNAEPLLEAIAAAGSTGDNRRGAGGTVPEQAGPGSAGPGEET